MFQCWHSIFFELHRDWESRAGPKAIGSSCTTSPSYSVQCHIVLYATVRKYGDIAYRSDLILHWTRSIFMIYYPLDWQSESVLMMSHSLALNTCNSAKMWFLFNSIGWRFIKSCVEKCNGSVRKFYKPYNIVHSAKLLGEGRIHSRASLT